MKILAVIPARYASTRFPGKPLTPLAGKPMIERVWRRVCQATSPSAVVVATDDERVRKAVQEFGGEAVLTRVDHRSGTERVAEVAATAAHKDVEIFVNVQGDEPMIAPGVIDQAVGALQADPEANVATLVVPITHAPDIMDVNVVKAVLNFDGDALYFSRAPIPWVRDRGGPVHARHLKHLGLYAYRREALLEFATFPQGELERAEQLEQLRWLENGYRIRVVETDHDSVGVDVPDDVTRVEQMLKSE
jgi:3-deoxy-manno-octulosonate cytidylyltransferase (CMP-KDO synthetase)